MILPLILHDLTQSACVQLLFLIFEVYQVIFLFNCFRNMHAIHCVLHIILAKRWQQYFFYEILSSVRQKIVQCKGPTGLAIFQVEDPLV